MLSLVSAMSSTSIGPIRILIIDDEKKMREAIAKAVRLEGWHAVEATCGAEGMALLTTDAFDLVLLDWMLPDRDGLEMLGEMRRIVAKLPVLMLTARGTVADKVTGLDNGADDYLAKPFSMVELVARCRVLLRRPTVAATELRCGDLKLMVRARCLQRGAEEILLTPQETDLLECLLSHPGQIVTRDMLETVVWRGTRSFASRDNILDVLISRIRQKIETPTSGRLIQTLRGLGYRVEK